MKKLLPWKAQKAIESVTYFSMHQIKKKLKTKKTSTFHNIHFICGYQGKSGGTQAIINIAKLLVNNYNVSISVNKTSIINMWIPKEVTLTKQIDESAELYICDLSTDINILLYLKKLNKKIIVSIHGLKEKLHQLDENHIKKVIELSDKVHFVSDVQQNSYKLAENKYFIIPNYTNLVNKTHITNNVGTVGNLDEPRKGALKTVELGQKSVAEHIHLWSTNKKWKQNKVISHPWCSNKVKIFNSFDVLVFLSESETFGLVIIEAMSAGIPCILSPLPVFNQFKECPGIYILDDKDTLKDKVDKVNFALINKQNLKEQLIEYYLNNYSPEVIFFDWKNKIDQLIT